MRYDHVRLKNELHPTCDVNKCANRYIYLHSIYTETVDFGIDCLYFLTSSGTCLVKTWIFCLVSYSIPRHVRFPDGRKSLNRLVKNRCFCLISFLFLGHSYDRPDLLMAGGIAVTWWSMVDFARRLLELPTPGSFSANGKITRFLSSATWQASALNVAVSRPPREVYGFRLGFLFSRMTCYTYRRHEVSRALGEVQRFLPGFLFCHVTWSSF